ncbi:hypothetical protein PAXRUDRAFT_821910 [Paxillus rubicundulus Ve08.2h10]|uniref:Uncharacterized protein n=1 Tax=Paxillus rubicundulus Ve08.2h10 TaxID=930991 RepID=A0A0D0ECZ0_9AGAM|nr:hypothetical protein PAXRUDRAFT_821910 [Paxillus rubicundulus Ve08.2h10]
MNLPAPLFYRPHPFHSEYIGQRTHPTPRNLVALCCGPSGFSYHQLPLITNLGGTT